MFFFFQAEDGIRDLTVTGVQTCALPISGSTSTGGGEPAAVGLGAAPGAVAAGSEGAAAGAGAAATRRGRRSCRPTLASLRSEERRVGKECRARGSPQQ